MLRHAVTAVAAPLKFFYISVTNVTSFECEQLCSRMDKRIRLDRSIFLRTLIF
jgi:hypothetical protein